MDPSTSNGGKLSWSYALSGKVMLSAIVALFAIVLLILFLHLYVRWHVIRRATRQARRRRQRLVFSSEGMASASCTVNRSLDPYILASLPVLLFSSDEGNEDESGECVVCLNQFEEGEKIRCLPDCGHRFHIECIDMWFYSHSNCPLCRTTVVAPKERAANVSDAVDSAASVSDISDNELCSSSLREEEMGASSSDSGFREVRIEIPATRTDAVNGQEEQQLSSGLESAEQQPRKPSNIRMVLFRWLLLRDPRIIRGGVSGSEVDLERGDRELHHPTSTESAGRLDPADVNRTRS